MEDQVKPKNIYQKLLVIQQRINGLGKDKDTKSQYNPNGYKYVTGEKVLVEIKPLMNDLGLILKQEVLSIENTRQDYSNSKGTKSEILSKVLMKFTWIDCETGDKDENFFGANGQNDWEKGLGSALTYAERYFLLKYFHICTDEDDIDNPDRKEAEKKEAKTTTKDLKTETQKTPEPPIEPEIPQMTESQKQEIIKMSSNKAVFNNEESKVILEWITKPRTKEEAERNINRLKAAIKTKETQPVTA